MQLRFDDQTKLNLLDADAGAAARGRPEKRHGAWQTRHFWLFNDKLVYGQARGLGGGGTSGRSGAGLFEARYRCTSTSTCGSATWELPR